VSIQLLSSIRRVAIAAAAGLLLAAGTANAIIFVGDFDPAFGPGIPFLGFRGHSTFDVSAGCLTSPGLQFDNGDNCIITLLGASVDLYDTRQSGTPTLQTLVFAPPPISPDPITAIFVAANLIDVTGIGMSVIGPQFADLSIFGGPLWLQFLLTDGTSNAFMYQGGCDGPCLNSPSNPASIHISRVPEPGSLALLFGALGAGWLARRLRKR